MTRVIIICCSLLLTGCVTMQRYSQMEEDMRLYKKEALLLDSLRAENISLQEELDATAWELRQANRELESLSGLYANLNVNYEGLLNRCDQDRADLEQALYLSGLEIATLRDSMAGRRPVSGYDSGQGNDGWYTEPAADTYYPPTSRQSAGGGTGYTATGNAQPTMGTMPTASTTDVQQKLAAMRLRRSELAKALQAELSGFAETDVLITDAEGKVVLSLLSPVIIPSGEQQLTNISRRVSTIIQRYEDFMVSVEGYSPLVMEYTGDLSQSTAQAIRVSSLLAAYGADPVELAALGYVTPKGEEESYYQTADPGRLQRVDIVFTPYWFDLFEP
jgi:hypothetical protein